MRGTFSRVLSVSDMSSSTSSVSGGVEGDGAPTSLFDQRLHRFREMDVAFTNLLTKLEKYNEHLLKLADSGRELSRALAYFFGPRDAQFAAVEAFREGQYTLHDIFHEQLLSRMEEVRKPVADIVEKEIPSVRTTLLERQDALQEVQRRSAKLRRLELVRSNKIADNERKLEDSRRRYTLLHSEARERLETIQRDIGSYAFPSVERLSQLQANTAAKLHSATAEINAAVHTETPPHYLKSGLDIQNSYHPVPGVAAAGAANASGIAAATPKTTTNAPKRVHTVRRRSERRDGGGGNVRLRSPGAGGRAAAGATAAPAAAAAPPPPVPEVVSFAAERPGESSLALRPAPHRTLPRDSPAAAAAPPPPPPPVRMSPLRSSQRREQPLYGSSRGASKGSPLDMFVAEALPALPPAVMEALNAVDDGKSGGRVGGSRRPEAAAEAAAAGGAEAAADVAEGVGKREPRLSIEKWDDVDFGLEGTQEVFEEPSGAGVG